MRLRANERASSESANSSFFFLGVGFLFRFSPFFFSLLNVKLDRNVDRSEELIEKETSDETYGTSRKFVASAN